MTDVLRARADREMLSYVVDSSEDAIFTKSRDGTITSWNPGAERLYGFSAIEAIGRRVATLIVPDELRGEQAEMTRRAFRGETVNRSEIERLRKDGSRVLVSLTITPVRNATGRIVSAATVARDVSERRRYEDRLQYLAAHDHLTGLLNRRSFEEELERELERAGREGETGALLSIDLDEFKQLNDIAGHAAGDMLLARVARALMANTRATDVVARLGGDEFAVLLANTGLARARAVAAKLLDALHACSVQVDGVPFRATASIGVATIVPGESRLYDLIVAADMAMYTAKQAGRDQIATVSASEAQSARTGLRRSWHAQIRHALEHGELQLFRQPIVDLGSCKISHSELLLRMRQGDELISPAAFLAPAERSGLIHAIDHWVVRAAVALLLTQPAVERRPVSVNLSGVSVAGDPELLGLIRSEIDVAGIEPSLLVFEITETAAIGNIGEARAFAEGIREFGCRIALDDFGTGFGSFYHLKHLPIDYIKIDHEFVHDVVSSRLDQRIIASVVEIATALGAETVAEAVGDEETVRVLRDLGVDYGQGFHLGHPVPLEDFVA
jgi:diguanylate cyclase (GGDEF)-like protein/PAS domain S-box-containing protein